MKREFLACAASVVFLNIGCGGGGGGDGGSPATAISTDISPQQPSSSVTSSLGPDGGTVELLGAELQVPAGALRKVVDFSLLAFDSRANTLPEGDGAGSGLIPAATNSFALAVSEDVTLTQPLRIRLPLKPAAGSFDPANLSVAADRSGYLIDQNFELDYDASANAISFDLPTTELSADGKQFVSSLPPHGAGIALLALVTAFGGTVSLNPFIATLKDFGYETLVSSGGHFNIRYRPPHSTRAEARALDEHLETAYQLFVKDMGFSLPNLFNFDGRYTIILDDLGTHNYVRNDANGNVPDGFTLPGSGLFEGASYVHTRGSEDKRQTTAVHEYFHALQAGSLTGITPTLADAKFFSQSSWWFEGSATALSGRVVFGQGSSPARDTTLSTHLSSGYSLFDDVNHLPAADVAQDFCYFLELAFGNTAFYRPVFERLGMNVFSDEERAVRAMDGFLADISDNQDSMGLAWRDFVYDWIIFNSADYGSGPNVSQILDHRKGDSLEGETLDLQPLSYQLMRVSVPPLKKDENDRIIPGQKVDLDISVNLSGTNGSASNVYIIATDQLGSTGSIRDLLDVKLGSPFEKRYENFRTTSARNLFVVVANSNQERSDNMRIALTSELAKLASYDVLFWRNFNGSQGGESLQGSDFSLSGDIKRPLIQWNGPPAIAIEVSDSRDSMEDSEISFDYGIISLDDEETDEPIPFFSPIRYGDYSVPNTEPFSVSQVPSPPLEAGEHIYFFTIASDDDRVGQFAIRLNEE